MKYFPFLLFLFLSVQVNGQMLEAVKSTIEDHLIDNRGITSYLDGLNISDATVDSDGKTITVKGTFVHEGFISNVPKPFVAIVRVVLDDLTVERLCYYKYLSLLDSWQLKCTNGKSTISPKPDYPKKF
jgi:hypothetical protein